MAWPADTHADLSAFYSAHQLRADGRPTQACKRGQPGDAPALSDAPLLGSLEDGHEGTDNLVAESSTRVLRNVLQHYGSLNGIKQARMHLYGGCYNYRRISGSGRLSTHAWGAGIDLDPDRNPLGKAYDEGEGMMPRPVIEIFEAEGWKWGGRFISRPDCMHFQATQ